MSLGLYNPKYFQNHPEECNKPAILYCVVLVDKQTGNRDCIKIGIAKGTTWKDALRRSRGFTNYEIRIQKIVKGSLEDIFYLEQWLHEKWGGFKFKSNRPFGGHTELFQIEYLPDILKSIPNTI